MLERSKRYYSNGSGAALEVLTDKPAAVWFVIPSPDVNQFRLAALAPGKCSFGYIGILTTSTFKNISCGAAGIAVACFAVGQLVAGGTIDQAMITKVAIGIAAFVPTITLMTAAATAGSNASGIASSTLLACYAYGLYLLGTMVADDADTGDGP